MLTLIRRAKAREVTQTTVDGGNRLALLDHHPLDLARTYGDPQVCDPSQYDELRIEHYQGADHRLQPSTAVGRFSARTVREEQLRLPAGEASGRPK